MVDRVGGFRRKTRYKMSKNFREKGKIRIRYFLQSFEEGDKVLLHAEPSYQKGMYHPRFYGKPGTISKKLGTCYEVKIKDFTKEKSLVVHPIHLRRLS